MLRKPKQITVREAVVTCSKCSTTVGAGQTYLKIGGFNVQSRIGYSIIRCTSCGFTDEELVASSPFKTAVLRLEKTIDAAVDALELDQDWDKFVLTIQQVVAELRTISTDCLTRYDSSPCQKLHRNLLSRGQQTKEIADHLDQLIEWKVSGKLQLSDVIERAPSDLIGIK
jgi:DNA-directed RNA polymerase subunit RPC12/RpoP